MRINIILQWKAESTALDVDGSPLVEDLTVVVVVVLVKCKGWTAVVAGEDSKINLLYV